MQKYLGVFLALAVVLGVFLAKDKVARFLPTETASHASSTAALPDFSLPALTFDNIGAAPVAIEAWAAFGQYVAAAKAHDLPALSALSYQLSPQCAAALADSAQMGPCANLMDTVGALAGGFRQEDFTHVAYDEKQIVLSTDYLPAASGTPPTKTVLYFVREPAAPKLLGIRFCFGQDAAGDECVRTAPSTRDANQNGWWDDVEALFKK
jgi:hypothetical protein